MTDARKAQEREQTWNYGGGKQSVAMACLIADGLLPVPKVAVIADTGREGSATWEYMNAHVQPMLAKVGLQIEVAPHSLATTQGLYSKLGTKLLLPVFTQTGKLPTNCSNEWKARVARRYLKLRGYGPDNPVTTWIGFSVDEADRIKPSDTKWQELSWPLCFDVPMRRHECIQYVLNKGLPEPPKSSCWMCPHHSDAHWRDLRDNYPEDWAKAIEVDHSTRARDNKGGVYLHRSLVPLDEANIDQPDDGQTGLFGDCGSGYCYT